MQLLLSKLYEQACQASERYDLQPQLKDKCLTVQIWKRQFEFIIRPNYAGSLSVTFDSSEISHRIPINSRINFEEELLKIISLISLRKLSKFKQLINTTKLESESKTLILFDGDLKVSIMPQNGRLRLRLFTNDSNSGLLEDLRVQVETNLNLDSTDVSKELQRLENYLYLCKLIRQIKFGSQQISISERIPLQLLGTISIEPLESHCYLRLPAVKNCFILIEVLSSGNVKLSLVVTK